MGKWLLPRDKKETRTCFSCSTYKMNAQFYEWYPHPAIQSFMGDEIKGIICSPCAKREAGARYFKKLKELGCDT